MDTNNDTLQLIRSCSKDDEAYEQLVALFQTQNGSDTTNQANHYAEQLRRSEANLRAMLDSTWQSFTLIDRDGCIVDADAKGKQSAQAIFGKEMHTGDSIYDFVLPKDHESFTTNFARALNGETIALEKYFDVPPNKTYYFEIAYFPVTDDRGDVIGVCMSHQDISDRKRLEADLRRYKNIVSSTEEGIALVSRDYVYEIVNDAYLSRTGLPREQIEGRPVAEIVGEQPFLETIKPKLDRALNGETVSYAAWFDLPEVGRRHFRVTYYPYYDEDEQITGVIANTRDTTVQRRAKQAIEDAEKQLRILIDQIPVMIALGNGQGELQYVNQHWLDRLGWTVEELAEYDDPLTVFYPNHDEYLLARQAVNRSDAVWRDFDTKTKSGDVIRTTWANIRLPDGSVVSIGQDITERAKTEQQKLQLALEKERVTLLTRFIRYAAHEFRTPLATVSASAYLMFRVEDQERRKVKLDQIQSQVDHLARLIDTLLMVVRLETGIPKIETGVNVGGLLHSVCDEINVRNRSGIPIQCEYPDDLPPVTVDQDLIAEALRQVLDNAQRFTPEDGSIIMRASVAGSHVVIDIEDTGSGIPADDLPHVFETFWRQDIAHTSPGFGLGLTIARTIIEQHGGTITIDSTEGQGTHVRVTLPVPGAIERRRAGDVTTLHAP